MCNAFNHHLNCDCGWGKGNNNNSQFKIKRRANDYLASKIKERSTYNSTCPVCGKGVFFYRSDFGGSVFFDSLGHPWPKHPCIYIDKTNKSKEDYSDIDVLDIGRKFFNNTYEIIIDFSGKRKKLYFKCDLEINIEIASAKKINESTYRISILSFEKNTRKWINIITDAVSDVKDASYIIKTTPINTERDSYKDIQKKPEYETYVYIIRRIAEKTYPFQIIKIHDLYKRITGKAYTLDPFKEIKNQNDFNFLILSNTILSCKDNFEKGRRDFLFSIVEAYFGKCFSDIKKDSWDKRILLKEIDPIKKGEICFLMDAIDFFMK